MESKTVNIKGIRIRSEDLQFLHGLGQVGVLDASDAFLFYPNHKPNSVQRRLRILTDNKITRTTELKDSLADESSCGRLPMLYSLTEKGADLLESSLGKRPARYLTGDPAAATFYHRRDVAKVVSSFTSSAIQAGLDEPHVLVLRTDVVPCEHAEGMPSELFNCGFCDGPPEECHHELGYDSELVARGLYEYLRLVADSEFMLCCGISIEQQEAFERARQESQFGNSNHE